jgi:hypothetical protein
MESDPWRLSESDKNDGIHLTKVGGQFLGYGGQFLHPPLVYELEGNLCVTDRKQIWRIDADSFGFRLHKMEMAPEDLKSNQASRAPKVASDGKVTWDNHVLLRPELAGSTSHACDGTTLAVTIASSFHVFLLSRVIRNGK